MRNIEKVKQKKGIIIGLSILLAIILAFGIWFLFFRQSKLTPDYTQIETNAQAIEGEGSEKMKSPKGGGAASLLYSKKVRVSLSQSTVSLLVGNPKKSTQDIVFQVIIDDAVIAESGRVVPGYQVQQISLDKKAKERLTNGGYNGIIRIFYFDETTEKKAMLNTDIPVKIEVNN